MVRVGEDIYSVKRQHKSGCDLSEPMSMAPQDQKHPYSPLTSALSNNRLSRSNFDTL
jgi:hypothetical protein